jgi:hypothetical protein
MHQGGKAQFQKSWDAWKAWAKLEEAEPADRRAQAQERVVYVE